MTKVLYLAYPIDKANGHPETRRIAETIDMLGEGLFSQLPLVVYDPGSAWSIGKGATYRPELQQTNTQALRRADMVLAFAPQGVRSWGVPTEVENARISGIPTAIVTDGAPSWAMPAGDTVRVFRTTYNDRVHNTWLVAATEALDWLATQPVRPKAARATNGADNTKKPLRFKSVVDDPIMADYPVEVPTRAYDDDAGLDLKVIETTWLEPGETRNIRTGLAVELPPWSWGFLVGRSSTLHKKNLMVNPGIIDPGYRGELFAVVKNLGDERVQVMAGERLAQLIVMANATLKVEPIMVDRLRDHARGSNGFGSSGA